MFRKVINYFKKNKRKQKRRWQEWSIGIYDGKTHYDVKPHRQVSNPVLSRKDVTDVSAAFVADPFMILKDNVWYMFFEVLNRAVKRGEIGMAVSNNGYTWEYQQIVLAQPFHLSYPYVFESGGNFYMIPETGRKHSVRLYKAIEFPHTWGYERDLLEGGRYVDSSIVRYQDNWWLFTENGARVKEPVLRLFYANDLYGEFKEHPKSPIMESNAHIARPGGRIILNEEKCIRYTQDVSPVYGSELRAFEITKLSTEQYDEMAIKDKPIISAGSESWNRDGMHHMDVHELVDGSWLAAVDGFRWHESIERWELSK